MITWSDGTVSTGSNYLDSYSREVEQYAFECEEFSKDLWIVRVYVGPYFAILTDYFRTFDETKEFMQFIRDLLALRFPDAQETALSTFKEEIK